MPAGDFFSRGVAPVASPFSAYLNPKTMTQQRSMSSDWGNVGARPAGSPFGQNQGDISQAGWTNPIDAFTQQAEREMAKMAGQPMTGVPGATGAMGSPNSPEWQQVNQWDAAVQAAAAKYGVDPNRLKAHMRIESGGDAAAVQPNVTNGYTYGLMQINTGIWGGTLAAQGIDPSTPEGNIMGAAYILRTLADQNGGNWDAASSSYFLGQPGWGQQGGLTGDTHNGYLGTQYRDDLNRYMAELSSAGGGVAGGGNASSVIQAATSFVGKVPYVWGGIPEKGQTPTGWDCSGFTYWLDQNLGAGQLPRGSHYQFQWAQQSGNLHGANQMQAGDLVFFDTGNRAGGGAELNAAGHVGMYIGNGQFVHAANPDAGTIISDFNQYAGMYTFLGAASMSWSGGGAYSAPMQGGGATYGYGSGSLFGNWASLTDPNAAWRGYSR